MTSPGTGQCVCNDDAVNNPDLGLCHKTWKDRFLAGQLPEGKYTECRGKRTKRHKVLTNADALPAELRRHPFRAAPALYTFNVARYFAMILRTREYAKQKKVQRASAQSAERSGPKDPKF